MRISLRRALLGAEPGEIDFVQMELPITTGSSIYPEQTTFARSTTRMQMVTLDRVLSDFPNQRFDLLKLDVQGAELDVIAGAKATLPKIEVIVIELSLLEYNKGGPHIGDVVSKLNTLGFQMFDVYPLSRHRSGALIQADAIFARHGARILPTPPFA